MQITIQGGTLTYIYLKEQNKYVDNIIGNPEYQCDVYFENDRNWIGIKIKNIDTDGKKLDLPQVGDIDYPINSSRIIEEADSITILFDDKSIISEQIEEECILDIHPSGIYGIELILYSTSIKGKEIVKPFIIWDI